LRGRLDRAEWISDLVCEPGRHLTEGGEPVALFHWLVELAVLERDRHLRREALQELHFVGGERVTQALVAYALNADDALLARDREGDARVHRLHRAQDLLERLGLADLARLAALRE